VGWRRYTHVFAGSLLGLGVTGAVALATHQPWLFPSLGPTVMLHMEKATAPEASPRDTLLGHLVALVVGYGMLAVCGLRHAPSALAEGVTGPRIAAAAGAVAVTAVVLLALRVSHAPAGATTLIVALGLLRTPTQLVIMGGAVLLLTAVDLLVNRAAGVRMPLWSDGRD